LPFQISVSISFREACIAHGVSRILLDYRKISSPLDKSVGKIGARFHGSSTHKCACSLLHGNRLHDRLCRDGEIPRRNRAREGAGSRELLGCHAIGVDGESPHPQAPPFRKLSERFPVDALEETFVNSIDTGHSGMPVFDASRQQIDDIVAYIGSVME
jgi:hypothetical protein